MDIGMPGEAAATEGVAAGCDDVLKASSRKRCRIREMLERSRKKRQQLNDTVDIHKQLREVTSGLSPGQRVYVRYEYDDLLEMEDGASQPQIIDAKMVWWPAQLAIYCPIAHLNRPSQPIVSSENKANAVAEQNRQTNAPATKATETKVTETKGAKETLLGANIPEINAAVAGACEKTAAEKSAIESAGSSATMSVAAAASAAPGGDDTNPEESRQYTAEEVFDELKDELSEDDRRCMVELMKTHAKKIVYTLDYEGREAFSPESIPCFFIDHENLMHLHKCWGAAVYRTESNIGEVNLEEPLEDGIDAVANLFVGGDEELGSSLSEVADKVVSMLTSFYRHADNVGSRTMTANDVCDYFAQQPEMTIVLTRLNNRNEVQSEDDAEDPPYELDSRSIEVDSGNEHNSQIAQTKDGLDFETKSPGVNQAACTPSPRLQDDPFPRR